MVALPSSEVRWRLAMVDLLSSKVRWRLTMVALLSLRFVRGWLWLTYVLGGWVDCGSGSLLSLRLR
jgi:hypothetical protein